MKIFSNFIPQDLYEKYIGQDPELRDKPISIFNDYTPSLEELVINPYNILVVMEPNELFGLHDWAIQNASNFSCILTWSEKILEQCSNAMMVPFGTTFLHGNNRYTELATLPKEFELSFICGVKAITEGHKLRHTLFKKLEQVTIPCKKYFTTEEPKEICFRNSMFHLAVENTKHKNYFTEKIVDAFLSKTIPIYWGCPNIGEFFDIRGMFILESEDDFISLVDNLTEEDYYSRKEYIEYNYKVALYYAEIFTRMNSLLKEIISLNNI